MTEEVGVEITGEGGVTVVAFRATAISGVEGIRTAAEQIQESIEENHPRSLIFDFERVKFFSSQVLGLLLDIRAKLKTYDGEVVISAIDPQLHRVFRITNLDKVFRFFPDRESAVREVSTG
jgi:anti-anti-sigma factor